jgi:hypothetical protein
MKLHNSEYTQYILHNVDNYKPVIHNTSSEILIKFTQVIIEYMLLISEKINIKNKRYYVFIFERGIDAIIHIFSMIYFYTKNLDLTFYHSQKAYYFYIEFIEQIADDNITFLQLSSKDALLFVYKKTIYDLNNEYKKKIAPLTNEEHIIIHYIDAIIDIYKKIVRCLINHNEFKYENKIEYIVICCNKIQKISNILNKNKIKLNYIECIYLFINLLANKQFEQAISIDIFVDSLEYFIKCLQPKRKILDEKKIINKIYDYEIDQSINEMNIDMMIKYIFN